MTELDRDTLAAVCDVFVPAVRPPAALADDPHGFFALTATEAGTSSGVAAVLPTLLDEQEMADLGVLLGALRRLRLGSLPRAVARGLLATLAAADEDAATGLRALRQLTLAVHYGGVGPNGANATWPQLGYPGPPPLDDVVPTDRLRVTRPGDADLADGTWRLHADVVVVGSGAGGGVVAARLAAAGLDVLVLEAGGDHQEQDFPTDELGALQALYWRSGLVTTEDDNVALLAGATLGGGTTVNWSNWVAPPAHVRAEWADEHGLDGVDGPDFDDDLGAVTARVGATDAGTRANGPNQRLLEGAKALGWQASLTTRNVDPDREDDDATGHTGFGDRSGAKQGSLRTWLRDAVADGARVVTGCEVELVLHDAGRATGVAGRWTDGDAAVSVEVRAPTVVLAAGALETPGVLLRSAIGGPAVGRHLRLHPVPAMPGLYDEAQSPWTGPPQGVVVDEFAADWDGHGYLLEVAHWHPGLNAALVMWPDPRDVKLLMSRFARLAPFIAVTRDRGSGSVTLGADGRPVVHHPVDDELDREVLRSAVRHLVDLHVAAGARAVLDATAPGRRIWRQGDPVEPFAEACAAAPMGAGGRRLFSAHQMGSARMGRDPRTSVADPDGQLHDVEGVWIGDASAFPSAVGANPMFTTMALAHRTAGRILAQR